MLARWTSILRFLRIETQYDCKVDVRKKRSMIARWTSILRFYPEETQYDCYMDVRFLRIETLYDCKVDVLHTGFLADRNAV